MSPTQIHDHQHARREANNDMMTPSPLKINKDSHSIKKSSPSPSPPPPSSLSSSLSSSSSSSSSTLANGASTITSIRTPPRHPVIIYTHSPKVIRTSPKDFMALVQKLTGLSHPEDDDHAPSGPKPEPGIIDKDGENSNNNNNNNNRHPIKSACNDDNESTSVITDENGGSIGEDQINSCYVPQSFDPTSPCFNSMPFFNTNSSEFYCSGLAQPFYNYSDSLLLMPSVRNSMSSTTLENMKELPEF